MRQVRIHGPDDVRTDAVPEPAMSARDVVVQVAACGICGSDLGYVAAGGLMGPSDSPMPIGHELSGTVVRAGKDVRAAAVGDRVILNPMGAGNDIGNGGPEGGFADCLLVRNVDDGPCLYPLPDSLSFEQGSLVEPLAVGMHAVNQGAGAPNDKVAVFGAGPVGLAAITALRARGVSDVIAVDRSRPRLALAKRLGAASALHPDDGDLFAGLGSAHGAASLYGMPMLGTGLFIEATGSTAVLRDLVAWAGTGAHIVVVALHKQPLELDCMTLLMKELKIIGAMAYPDQEFRDVIAMLESGQVDVSPMISARYPLAAFDAAFARAKDPEHGAKVLVQPSASAAP